MELEDFVSYMRDRFFVSLSGCSNLDQVVSRLEDKIRKYLEVSPGYKGFLTVNKEYFFYFDGFNVVKFDFNGGLLYTESLHVNSIGDVELSVPSPVLREELRKRNAE
jgi:hypothetical protein